MDEGSARVARGRAEERSSDAVGGASLRTQGAREGYWGTGVQAHWARRLEAEGEPFRRNPVRQPLPRRSSIITAENGLDYLFFYANTSTN